MPLPFIALGHPHLVSSTENALLHQEIVCCV